MRQRASLTHDAGSPKPVLRDNLKGGLRREVGEGSQREGPHAYLWLAHVRHRPSQGHNYPPTKTDTFEQVFNQSNAGFHPALKKVKSISTNRAISTNKG